MEKPADTGHRVHSLIRDRWSPRSFADVPVLPGTVRQLLEAARWAPSCMNEQPWSFIVATREEPDAYERMFSCLVPGNQTWAHAAPLLLIAVARTTFARNGKPNPHAWHDVGLAMGNLTVQATSLGLAVHQMAGIDRDKIREVYGIPDGFEPVSAAAIGYPGKPDALPDDLAERERSPRSRKPQEEFVFSVRWDQPL
jgi:nitroreductase